MNKSILLITLAIIQGSPATAAVRSYFAPQWQGERLDACLSGSVPCGKPAADAFCRAEGFDNAILFQREPGLLTRKLDSNQRCEGASCTSFKQIKCYSQKADLAGLEQPGE